jgi:molybdopterin-guanine dinucleotide biosynthesis protein A
MGTDKAFLTLGGRTLVERAVTLARSLTGSVYLVGHSERLARFGPVVEDIYPDHGPLGGIHAALVASQSDLNLILAVDAPFVSQSFLRFLVQSAKESGTVVTAPQTARGWEPLCAVYRRAFAEHAENALRAGRNRIDSLFASVTVHAIEEAELRRLAFDPAMFDNVNTPADWQRAQQRTGAAHE